MFRIQYIGETPFFSGSNGFISKSVFVVVGGISTGRHIAPMLRGHGYSVIHVQPKYAKGLGISHNPADYIASFSEDDDFERLVAQLSPFTIRSIIPGCEAGVHLADRLNEHFKMEDRNDFSKSRSRTNKFFMQEAIREAGIRATRQACVDTPDALMGWIADNGYPVVLKPEESAGTDGVFICTSDDEAIAAFHAIMGKSNIYGFKNHHVVVQEQLIGDEFMVDTVSDGEETVITEIILGRKTVSKGTPLYDYSLTIPSDDPRYDGIADYVKQVLPALGFRRGAAHTEVIVTDKGPTLVEVNCRLAGGLDISAITDALGMNQVEVLVNAYIKPGYIAAMARAEKRPPYQANLTSFFIVDETRKIWQEPDLRLFADIPGFLSIKFGSHKGELLEETTSLMDAPGEVNFVGKDATSLLASHAMFRAVEREFYAKACLKPATDKMELLDSPASSSVSAAAALIAGGLSMFDSRQALDKTPDALVVAPTMTGAK